MDGIRISNDVVPLNYTPKIYSQQTLTKSDRAISRRHAARPRRIRASAPQPLPAAGPKAQASGPIGAHTPQFLFLLTNSDCAVSAVQSP